MTMFDFFFRGQTRRYGEKVKNFAGDPMESAWAYGPGVFKGGGDKSIIYGAYGTEEVTSSTLDRHVIYSDTLGLWTGWTDKNGAKVFTDDICRFTGHAVNDEPFIGVCVWNREKARVEFNCGGTFFEWIPEIHAIEVIGNVHDNPELCAEIG